MEVYEEFTPRAAIVTGSDSGIGRAAAVELARAGRDVGITWRSDERGAQRTADLVRAAGRRAVVRHLDLTDLDDAVRGIGEMADELGGLDAFVANAGMGAGGPFLELSLEDWQLTLRTNLDGTFATLQAAARRMARDGRGGRLVAVTSVHAHSSGVGAAPYAASKHGITGMVKTIALELAHLGITANCVAPGEVVTPMSQPDAADAHAVDPRHVVRPGIPTGRPGHAHEVAAMIAFLCSPAASYLNGQSIAVDGGMLLMGPQAGGWQPDEWRPRA